MHPEAKEPESRKAIKPLQKRIPRVIKLLETLRPVIDDIHDQWRKTSAAVRGTARKQDLAEHPTNDSPLSWNYASSANILDVQDHQDLAVDLAKKEIQRRRRAGGALEEGQQRLSSARQALPPYMDDDELRRQMEATRRQLDRADGRATAFDDETNSRSSTYYYPSISKSSSLDYERPASQGRPDGPRPQPPRPPKELHAERHPVGPPPRPNKDMYLERNSPMLPPPRPGKEELPSSAFSDYSSLHEQAPALPPKAPAEPARQERVSFRPAATLENSEPLRPVFLPSGLRKEFLAIAADNTRKGLEMCGMLCGTTVNNALFISHLVIPEQRCTSDTCDTENESVMLDYCINHDLIVIGWIHTHPTQTCFMSSRDLHTQAGYQVMMPESIAIVCAPHSEPS
jgi:STAM-binding protein